jgi:hypothetical protein
MSSRFSRQDPSVFLLSNNNSLHMVLLWKFKRRTLVVNSQLNTVFDDVISAHPIHSGIRPFFSPQLEWIRGSLCTWLCSSYGEALHNVLVFNIHRSHFMFTVLMLIAGHRKNCWDLGVSYKGWYWFTLKLKILNSVALVREQTIPTERPPLVGEVSANFCGWRVSRRQHNGFPRSLI